jgi:hypothetical protein
VAHPLEETDLYRRIGGKAALTQLLDPQQTGTWDAETAELAMQDGWNLVVSAAGVQSEFATLTKPQLRDQFPDLIMYASFLALPLLWQYGTSGQAVPQTVKDKEAQAKIDLELYAQRKRKHGSQSTNPAAAQRVALVDPDPDHNRMTLAAFKGFI